LDKEVGRGMYDIIPSSDRKAAKDIQKVTPYRGMTEMLEKASYDPKQRCIGCCFGAVRLDYQPDSRSKAISGISRLPHIAAASECLIGAADQ
jgi:hypothetical protein